MTELTSLIAKYITRDTHKGSVNRIRLLMEADLEALIDKRVREARIDELMQLQFCDDLDDASKDANYKYYIQDRLETLSAKQSSKEDV